MESSFISSKEHLVELAKGFNLLSNVFMSVALKEIDSECLEKGKDYDENL